MVGKGGFRPGDDFLSFVGKENDEIFLRAFVGGLSNRLRAWK